jgi:Sel1 repeat
VNFFRKFLAAIVCGVLSASVFADAKEAWRLYLAKNYESAVALAMAPAEEGDKDAQYLMGLATKHGRGIANDETAAIRWFTLAAERGHADALNDLATCFSRGEGVARDYAKAFELFKSSAERGSAAGQRNLGKMYETGVGTQRDPLKALYWYEQTDASLYSPQVKRRLATIHGPPLPGLKLAEGCVPRSPPLRKMRDSRTYQVSGNLDVFLDEKGGVRGVRLHDISNEAFRYETVAVFSASLRRDGCEFEPGLFGAEVRLPFRFELR